MKHVSAVAAFAALSPLLCAQVVEIPAMTVPTSSILMSQVLPVPAGGLHTPTPTTVQALRAAGSNGGAPLAAISLTPSQAPAGLYNTNPELGRALARNASGLVLVYPPSSALNVPDAQFLAFDATIDLQVTSTQFGLAIGDWLGSMVIELRDAETNALVTTFTTSPYTTAGPKFFRSALPFTRIVIRADSPDGNWVIPELHVPATPPWQSFGVGCAGSNGVPQIDLVAEPRINTTFTLSVIKMPVAGGIYVMALGFSSTTSPFGPLPFDMSPAGAPGCRIYTDLFDLLAKVHTNGTDLYDLSIPNDPLIVGAQFLNQAFVLDPAANALGISTSNAGRATVK